MELVSVVIPTYSRNEMLIRAIESVLNQSYKNFEIIVIDDNDEKSEFRIKTEFIMKRYEQNPKIRYIKNKVNLGGAGSRNVGILQANGKYIALLDDDDEYLPNNIESLLKIFQNSRNEKLGLVYGFSEVIKENDKRIGLEINCNGNCIYDLLVNNCISATSQWMCKKKALLDVDMFSIVPCKQDSILMLKLLKYGYEIQCVPKVLTRYYDYLGDRISRNGKTAMGEIHYRNLGRQVYDKFNSKQIFEIEFSFAKRLLLLYIKQKQYGKAIVELKTMCIVSYFKTMKVLLISLLHMITSIYKK
jgi:glycosyltransferase involved in cell wall biosynthesis